MLGRGASGAGLLAAPTAEVEAGGSAAPAAAGTLPGVSDAQPPSAAISETASAHQEKRDMGNDPAKTPKRGW